MAQAKEMKRIGDDAVRAKTGKGWAEWFKIFDAAGAKKMTHAEIASYLGSEMNVPSWWRQMVAVEYEKERGLRVANQKGEGNFNAGVSRTLSIPVSKVYKAFADENTRRSWLKDDRMEITTARTNKSIRGKWGDTSRVSLMLYSRGASKSQLVFDEFKIPSAAEASRRKKFWSEAIDRMKEFLES